MNKQIQVVYRRLAAGMFCLWLLTMTCSQIAVAADSPGVVSKHALVIGNGAYSKDPLKNPAQDAHLMSETLKSLGFEVIKSTDLDRKGMLAAVDAFTRKLPSDAVSLIYFAGHGMQIEGTNYLIPTNMVPGSAAKVATQAFPVSLLLERMSASASAVNVLVLDACRDNPFLPQGAERYRSFKGLGLARMTHPRGVFLAYATAPGQLADDGKDQSNGVYTAALARWLKKPHLTIEQVFKGAGEDVRKATLEDQQPWFESSLVDDFYFLPPEGVSVRPKRVEPGKLANGSSTTRGSTSESQPWYMSLEVSEWDRLDYDISQRAQHLTPDEIPLLEHRAKNNNVIAMTTLGLAYLEGMDKSTDSHGRTLRSGANNSLALKWLRAAADHDFPMAQVLLGEMYFQGRGVDLDRQQARYWYEKAARVNYERAKSALIKIKLVSGDGREGGAELLNMIQQTSDIYKQR